MTTTTTAQAVRSCHTSERHRVPVINHMALLAEVDLILKFSSVFTSAQCALMQENAELTLHYIARELNKNGGAA